MKLKKHIRMYSMYFCRYWMTDVSQIRRDSTVDFKNTILIMTSNIGSPYLLDGIDENGDIKPECAGTGYE